MGDRGLDVGISRRCGRGAVLATVLGLLGVSLAGCVTDFVAPLSVASHRYPSVAQAVMPKRGPAKPQLVAEVPSTGERLPTAREIFDLHPPGSDPEHMRSPFLLNPNEGPLRISTLSRADAAEADKMRARQVADAKRMATLRAKPPAPAPATTVQPQPTSGNPQ